MWLYLETLPLGEVIQATWGHRVGPSSNRTHVLTRGGDPRDCSHKMQGRGPLRMLRRRPPATQGEASPQTTPFSALILDFQLPELWENKCLFFESPILWYFIQPELTKMSRHHLLHILFWLSPLPLLPESFVCPALPALIQQDWDVCYNVLLPLNITLVTSASPAPCS